MIRLLMLACLAALTTAAAPAVAQDRPTQKPKTTEQNKPFDDADFVAKAASGGMHEVELGKLANKMAMLDDVRKFGKKMVEDHTQANAELMKVAKAGGFTVPEKMNEKDQKAYDRFKDEKLNFDKMFVKHMVKDHENDVAEFTRASKEAKDPKIKEFATKTLPTLKEHLEMVTKLNDQIK